MKTAGLSASVALVAASLAAVLAADITVNTPNEAWQPGTNAPVSWTVDPGADGPLKAGSTGKLELVRVTDPNGKGMDVPVATIASVSLAQGGAGSTTFAVPQDIQGNSDYAIRFTPDSKDAGQAKYSAQFKINGGPAAPPATSTSSSGSSTTDGSSSATSGAPGGSATSAQGSKPTITARPSANDSSGAAAVAHGATSVVAVAGAAVVVAGALLL